MRTWKMILMIVGICLGGLTLLSLSILCCIRRRWKIFANKQGGICAYDRAFSGIKVLDGSDLGIELAEKWRKSYPIKSFVWSHYPVLLASALERGWGAFAFAYKCTSQCPVSSSENGFALCTKCSLGESFQPEVSWEISPGTDFMQVIRLNPRLVESSEQHGNILVQALQSALPLPGPLSALSSFPQEGYFEVTIVAIGNRRLTSDLVEGDDIKLILRPSPSDKYPVKTDNGTFQNAKTRKENRAKTLLSDNSSGLSNVLGVGFTTGTGPPFRLPGADKGSVGMHSNGCIFLNGETGKPLQTKREWGMDTTIGCGFSPLTRRVFFTLDGELALELKCNNREFNYPLHAVIASNYDVTLLVNYGQCSFEFLPANNQRVVDPCSNLVTSDDSSDLFSIRRLDSNWWSGRRTSSLSQPEADSDLFEIALHVENLQK